jgi:hypothetical protein
MLAHTTARGDDGTVFNVDRAGEHPRALWPPQRPPLGAADDRRHATSPSRGWRWSPSKPVAA